MVNILNLWKPGFSLIRLISPNISEIQYKTETIFNNFKALTFNPPSIPIIPFKALPLCKPNWKTLAIKNMATTQQ